MTRPDRSGDRLDQGSTPGSRGSPPQWLPFADLDPRRREFDECLEQVGRRPSAPVGMPEPLPDLVRLPVIALVEQRDPAQIGVRAAPIIPDDRRTFGLAESGRMACGIADRVRPGASRDVRIRWPVVAGGPVFDHAGFPLRLTARSRSEDPAVTSTNLVPLVLINAVGLTSRYADARPRTLSALADRGWTRPLREVIPAVTCTAQATLLTGTLPSDHGIVANGWLFRETGEVRFWQQSNALIQAEPLYVTARRIAAEKGRTFRVAQLFWWFNQGADVAWSVTPKPYYGADGNKAFGIFGTPDGLTDRLETALGPFPFRTFWGPGAGLPCTDWIARCAAKLLRDERPELSLVYLPHLDYDPQKFGVSGSDMPRLVRELDDACIPLLDAAKEVGARVWVVSEYGHCDVSRPVYLNRVLRHAGLLSRDRAVRRAARHLRQPSLRRVRSSTRPCPCPRPRRHPRVVEAVAEVPGVGRVVRRRGERRRPRPRAIGRHRRLSEPDAWFAYPFWLDDAFVARLREDGRDSSQAWVRPV